jgi:hypothetical protein
MKTTNFAFLAFALAALPACSSNTTMDSVGASNTTPDSGESSEAAAVSLGGANPAGTAGDDQTPPTTNGTEVEAWLAAGSYRSWNCEASSHPQMKVSPHGTNRICSNAKSAAFAGDSGEERPMGTAAVKELLDDASKLVGYAVYVKTKPASEGGAGWYWYERVPLTSMAPNTLGVVADGLGSEGRANAICVGCHAGAGTNADHTTLGSSDFVYTQVRP